MLTSKRRNLKDCFEIFDEIHNCVNDTNALRRITREALKDFAAEQVWYLELRSTPRSIFTDLSKGALCDKRTYIQTILEEFERFVQSSGASSAPLIPRLLISIDRSGSVEDAVENVSLAVEFSRSTGRYSGFVVGVDLGGNPFKNDVRDFIPALQMARNAGLKISAHVGEIPCGTQNDSNPSLKRAYDEAMAVASFKPDRIGHALFVPDDFWTLLNEDPVPVECCPTSNVMTLELTHHEYGNLEDGLRNHPQLSKWLETDYPLSINTDDPGVFLTNASSEWQMVANTFHLTKRRLADVVLRSSHHIFEPSSVIRTDLVQRLSERINILCPQ